MLSRESVLVRSLSVTRDSLGASHFLIEHKYSIVYWHHDCFPDNPKHLNTTFSRQFFYRQLLLCMQKRYLVAAIAAYQNSGMQAQQVGLRRIV